MSRTGLCAVLALVWLGCGGAPPIERRGPAASRWSYTFAVDPELDRLRTHLCFEGRSPYALGPIDASGHRYLHSARGPGGAPLPRVDGHLLTGELPLDSCIRYEVDLEAAARDRGGIQGAYRIDGDLVASTAVWLWAPLHRARGAEARVRFQLPDGVHVSRLWPRGEDGTYLVDERAFRFTAYAAFGRFQTQPVPVPGGCLHVSILGEGLEMGAAALERSVARGASAASMLTGRFPQPEVGLLIVPTPFSSSSPFGVVGRGTMPTVAILVGERATEERLTRAWVPVHEFSHLATPFIDRRDAWLAEGLATYYQEVLRARGGLLSAHQAWANLLDGFERGAREATGRTLADESRDMMETAAFRRVYWAGAAIALMADVQMRLRSGGRHTLDDALARLAGCCADRLAPLGADEAMRRLDGGGPPIFSTIARRALDAREPVDLSSTFEALGIARTRTGVTLGDDPHGLRAAIMAPRDDLAQHPPGCGAPDRSARRRGQPDGDVRSM